MCLSGRLYNCARCHAQVIICSDCDRGQIYCTGECANLARQESIRKASERYQQTRQGKHNHAERQQRYRENQQTKKIVTHHGSSQEAPCDLLSLSPTEEKITSSNLDTPNLCCHFCQKPVSNFLRTDFLTTTAGFSSSSQIFVSGQS